MEETEGMTSVRQLVLNVTLPSTAGQDKHTVMLDSRIAGITSVSDVFGFSVVSPRSLLRPFKRSSVPTEGMEEEGYSRQRWR